MNFTRAGDLVLAVVLGVVLLRMLPSTLAMWRIYAGVRQRRLADAAGRAPVPPAEIARSIDRLKLLRFSRIGERTLVLPGDQRRFEWNLADARTTTYVALVPAPTTIGGVVVAFYSAFADGAFVATQFPRGTTIHRPDLLTGAVDTTLEEAYTEHLRRIGAFSRVHGAPLPNRSMADLLARDDTYRSRHGGLTIRRRVYGYVALTAAVLLATSWSLARFLAD